MKRIYIAGAGGMLGEAFYHTFKKNFELKCTDIDLNEKWLSYLDFRDFDSYKKDVLSFKPDYLFHLGAYTSLEFCEKEINNAYITNTLSVENATYIANYLNIPLLYISTAGIFDGSQDTYDDWSQPNPLGVYARSKYMGELFVKENAQRYLICRAGWMMGGGLRKDKKFINKIITQIIDGKKTLNIVNDRFGTPTYTHDFAKNLKLILEKEYWGLYNLVCKGNTSRLDVTKKILNFLNLEDKINLNVVNSEFFRNQYFAPRPESEILINRKLELRSLDIMRDWDICLKEYIINNYIDLVKNDDD